MLKASRVQNTFGDATDSAACLQCCTTRRQSLKKRSYDLLACLGLHLVVFAVAAEDAVDGCRLLVPVLLAEVVPLFLRAKVLLSCLTLLDMCPKLFEAAPLGVVLVHYVHLLLGVGVPGDHVRKPDGLHQLVIHWLFDRALKRRGNLWLHLNC